MANLNGLSWRAADNRYVVRWEGKEWTYRHPVKLAERLALLETLYRELASLCLEGGACAGCGEDVWEPLSIGTDGGGHADGCPLLPLLAWQPEMPPGEGEQLALAKQVGVS